MRPDLNVYCWETPLLWWTPWAIDCGTTTSAICSASTHYLLDSTGPHNG